MLNEFSRDMRRCMGNIAKLFINKYKNESQNSKPN